MHKLQYVLVFLVQEKKTPTKPQNQKTTTSISGYLISCLNFLAQESSPVDVGLNALASKEVAVIWLHDKDSIVL